MCALYFLAMMAFLFKLKIHQERRGGRGGEGWRNTQLLYLSILLGLICDGGIEQSEKTTSRGVHSLRRHHIGTNTVRENNIKGPPQSEKTSNWDKHSQRKQHPGASTVREDIILGPTQSEKTTYRGPPQSGRCTHIVSQPVL